MANLILPRRPTTLYVGALIVVDKRYTAGTVFRLFDADPSSEQKKVREELQFFYGMIAVFTGKRERGVIELDFGMGFTYTHDDESGSGLGGNYKLWIYPVRAFWY